MMTAGLMALALAAGGTGQFPPANTLSRVAACGVEAGSLSERLDQDSGDTIVTVRQAAFRNQTISCLARLSWRLLVDFEFTTPELQARFRTAWQDTPEARAGDRRMRAENRKWLAQNGLLKEARRIHARKGDLIAQARDVEILCGFAPQSILKVSGGRVLVGRLEGPMAETFDDYRKLFAVMQLVFPDGFMFIVGEDAGATVASGR